MSLKCLIFGCTNVRNNSLDASVSTLTDIMTNITSTITGNTESNVYLKQNANITITAGGDLTVSAAITASNSIRVTSKIFVNISQDVTNDVTNDITNKIMADLQQGNSDGLDSVVGIFGTPSDSSNSVNYQARVANRINTAVSTAVSSFITSTQNLVQGDNIVLVAGGNIVINAELNANNDAGVKIQMTNLANSITANIQKNKLDNGLDTAVKQTNTGFSGSGGSSDGIGSMARVVIIIAVVLVVLGIVLAGIIMIMKLKK